MAHRWHSLFRYSDAQFSWPWIIRINRCTGRDTGSIVSSLVNQPCRFVADRCSYHNKNVRPTNQLLIRLANDAERKTYCGRRAANGGGRFRSCGWEPFRGLVPWWIFLDFGRRRRRCRGLRHRYRVVPAAVGARFPFIRSCSRAVDKCGGKFRSFGGELGVGRGQHARRRTSMKWC